MLFAKIIPEKKEQVKKKGKGKGNEKNNKKL
jgi:hypothetical protein